MELCLTQLHLMQPATKLDTWVAIPSVQLHLCLSSSFLSTKALTRGLNATIYLNVHLAPQA